MKLLKKVLAGVAVAAAMASASASTITVGGVSWDPDATGTLADNDFTGRFNFVQWFTTASNAVGNAINAAPTPGLAINPAVAIVGDVLQGVGVINTLNNTTNFANGGELTFVFGGFTVSSFTAAGPTFGGGWLKIYHDATADYNSGAGTGANDGTLWLSLVSDFNSYGGTTLNTGSLASYFSATAGDAFGNFKDANLPVYFGSDAQSSASAQFNGNYAASAGTLQSNTIPEPESLALVGLGLLGLVAARRRKAA